MDENILGKNIKYMRKFYGETLDELGFILQMTKSTVNDYESGRRKPTPETIKKISNHYGKTVDEMLNIKLYELDEFDSSEIVDFYEMFNIFSHILPLLDSPKANQNHSFANGMALIKNMLKSLNSGEFVSGSVISEAVDFFIEAIESNISEAYANMLWCIFFQWTQQYADLTTLQKLQSRLNAKQVDWKELIYETQKDQKKSTNKRKEFIRDFDESINLIIKVLKETNQWSQLGDYYLALRYVLGIIDNDCTNEMNQMVGMQMICAFAQLDNQYALNFIKLCN